MNNILKVSSLLCCLLLLVQWAEAKDYSNSIGMIFKTIPAGSFYMGSCKQGSTKQAKGSTCPSGAGKDSYAEDNETPQHEVHINKSFQLGAYEVTLGQFKKFLIGAERSDLLTDDFTKANSHGDKAAVSQVSWNDAHLFVNWLNKKEGGNHYRLPSEAEWEYAARAGTTTIYSWGNSPSLIDDYAWYASNAYDAGERYAHAVGKKQPNPWGLYDMQGNLWEWVQDNWHDNYDGAPLSGSAWVDKNIQNRVDRGGSWGHDAENLRSAVRGNVSPDNRNVFVGFRILRQP